MVRGEGEGGGGVVREGKGWMFRCRGKYLACSFCTDRARLRYGHALLRAPTFHSLTTHQEPCYGYAIPVSPLDLLNGRAEGMDPLSSPSWLLPMMAENTERRKFPSVEPSQGLQARPHARTGQDWLLQGHKQTSQGFSDQIKKFCLVGWANQSASFAKFVPPP